MNPIPITFTNSLNLFIIFERKNTRDNFLTISTFVSFIHLYFYRHQRVNVRRIMLSITLYAALGAALIQPCLRFIVIIGRKLYTFTFFGH